MNDENKLNIIVLAAGKGTRMKSELAKVLHPLGGRPMISYILDTAQSIAGKRIFVVTGFQYDQVEQTIKSVYDVSFVRQYEQKGTGHAVMCALPKIQDAFGHVIVLCGDTPLLRADSLRAMYQNHVQRNVDVTVLATVVPIPDGYGRVIINDSGDVVEIVEDVDADAHQKKIRLVNTGVYCLRLSGLTNLLENISCDNAQGEFYLTDIVAIGNRMGKKICCQIDPDYKQFMGINSIKNLSAVESLLN